MTAALIAAAAVLLAAAAVLAYLIASGRKVVHPSEPEWIAVTAASDAVALPTSPATRAPGSYGLWFDGPGTVGHARLGQVLEAGHATTTRKVEAVTGGSLEGAVRGRFTGHVFTGPGDASAAPWTEVAISAPSGACPAWVSTPATSGETWAVHIHGFGTTRVTALRTLPAADRAGLVSIIPSFRGDGEGPTTPGAPSTLGQTEWEDVDAAVAHAAGSGAKRIILFGWSMGAAAALLLAERSRHRELIAGMVLIAPVVDWGALINAGAKRAGLPAAAGSLTAWGLQLGLVDKLLSIPVRLDFAAQARAVDAAARRMPILILHTADDPLVPFAASAALAAEHPDAVTLVPFEGSGHALEFNQHPEAFDAAISTWLGGLWL